MKRLLLALVASAAAVVPAGTALAAGSTPASWSTPANVADTTIQAGRAQDLRVVVDESGNAVYAWRESDGTTFRVRTRTCTATTCNAVENLTDGTANVSGLRLVLDADGTATAVWTLDAAQTAKLQARARRAGTWGTAVDLYTGADRPTLQDAAAFGGGALAVAHTTVVNGTVTANVTTCTAALALCTTASPSSAGLGIGGLVADANGATQGGLAWVEQQGLNRTVRWAPLTAANGTVTVGATTNLSGATDTTKTGLAIDVDRGGLTTVAWKDGDALMVQRFAPTAPPSAPASAATAGPNPVVDDSIAVASDDTGSAVVTWATSQNGAQVLSALPYAALVKGTQQAITGDGIAQLPALAVGGTGQSAIAFLRGNQVATASATTPASAWTGVDVAPLNGASVALRPSIAAARNGATVLAWIATSTTTGEHTLRTARFTPAKTVVKPTVEVKRRTKIRWTLATQVTTNLSGTFEQVGRITVRGKRVIACRVTPRPISGNVSTAVICKLNRTAIKARKRAAIRIRLTTTFVASTGDKATSNATFTLPRKR